MVTRILWMYPLPRRARPRYRCLNMASSCCSVWPCKWRLTVSVASTRANGASGFGAGTCSWHARHTFSDASQRLLFPIRKPRGITELIKKCGKERIHPQQLSVDDSRSQYLDESGRNAVPVEPTEHRELSFPHLHVTRAQLRHVHHARFVDSHVCRRLGSVSRVRLVQCFRRGAFLWLQPKWRFRVR
jgi:hypothetical protein